MLLIMAGMSTLFESKGVRIGVALLGGVLLLLMGGRVLTGLGKAGEPAGKYAERSPLWIGIILTGGNPYFLLWWASVGLALASGALQLGKTAFALFAVVHWLCDLVWLEALSLAGFKGARLFGNRGQRVVLVVCALALIAFGGMFIWDGARNLARLGDGAS